MQPGFRILLIEDNEGDIFLVREALCREAPCDITVVGDGDHAIEYLRGVCAGSPRPDLVILDLNLPRMDGSEVLAVLRGTPMLRDIPVAVFSSTPEDMLARHAADADCRIVKPIELDAYMEVGKKLLDCARRHQQGAAPVQ